jgi:tRNA ligase
LCDDSFEEHVLPYAKEQTGLHLHGINKSMAEFITLPSISNREEVTVQSFASEWGFLSTEAFTLQSADEVKRLTNECGLTGSWKGKPIEGFVVRTSLKRKLEGKPKDCPPYPPGSSFFFKVKFDEPYMMYRDWREMTKSYISAFDKVGLLNPYLFSIQLIDI